MHESSKLRGNPYRCHVAYVALLQIEFMQQRWKKRRKVKGKEREYVEIIKMTSICAWIISVITVRMHNTD